MNRWAKHVGPYAYAGGRGFGRNDAVVRLVAPGTVGMALGAVEFASAPDFSDVSNWSARQFVEGRVAYIQSRLTGTILPAARSLYEQARTMFANAKWDMETSITLSFLDINSAQQQALMAAESTFQRAVETERTGQIPGPDVPGPYQPPVFGQVPWWAWVGAALVGGLYVFGRLTR